MPPWASACSERSAGAGGGGGAPPADLVVDAAGGHRRQRALDGLEGAVPPFDSAQGRLVTVVVAQEEVERHGGGELRRPAKAAEVAVVVGEHRLARLVEHRLGEQLVG